MPGRCRLLAAVLLAACATCRRDPLPVVDSNNRELVAGRRIFVEKCASCHNRNGDGRTITAGRFPYANLIDGKWRGDGTPASIEQQVRRGHDPMPKFEGKLTDEEIREVVAYVGELSKSGAKGEGQKVKGVSK
jgi:mono/diheme cytochrome c family protein